MKRKNVFQLIFLVLICLSTFAFSSFSLDGILANPPGIGTIAVPKGTHTLDASSDRTIPAGVTLRVMHGGVIIVPTGRTLTINGPIEAGPYEIFYLVGTGIVNASASPTLKTCNSYYHWWGSATGANADGGRLNWDSVIPTDPSSVIYGKHSLQGDIVYNTGSTAGGSPGWTCTTPGVNGTDSVWKPLANSGS